MDHRIIETYAAVMNSAQQLEKASGEPRLSREELEKEIELCRSRIEAGTRAYDQTTALYAPVFGMPPALNAGGGELALRMAEKDFFDTALRRLLFEPQKGFLARKPKAADYHRFCRSALMLKSCYSERLPRLERQLEELKKNAQKKDAGLQAGLDAARANICGDAAFWSTYPPSMDGSRELYMGEVEIPVDTRVAKSYRAYGIVENDGDSDWLHLPFTYSADKPFSVLVSYEGDTREGEAKMGNLIRSMMYQIIRTMPPYSYEFVYLDPAHAGASMRELLRELGGVVDGNAWQLHEKLYPDNVYRMLTVASSKEEVRQQLKRLEDRIAVTTSICAGETVAQFNAEQFDEEGRIVENNVGVIPQVFVFYENIHGILDQSATEILQKLATCAGISGISLVATSVRGKGKPLTEEERQLLQEDEQRDDLDHIEIMPDGCSLYIDADAMGESADKNLFFNFQPRLEDMKHTDFLGLVSASFRPSLEKETGYAKRLDLDAVWGKSDGAEMICIPIGVNMRDKVVYQELGSPSAAHALLAGSTGCGKSSFLHAIINGVITHYKPTDVQLWLSDYKAAEFRRYMTKTPPHVKYVGLATSVEYTLSFLDRLFDEYKRRQRAFGICTSTAEYRQIHGADSMPRLLIVVDEFHVMSDHIREYPEYKRKLANLLREARAMGMTFLLADQTCGVGLQGLTDDAKLQLTCRMAMLTTDPEYNAVFDITNAKDVIQTQNVFEVTVKRKVTQLNALGKEEVRTYYERCKTLFADRPLRDEIALRSIRDYGPAEDPMFVLESERAVADWGMVAEEEQKLTGQRGIPVWLGVPVTLDHYCKIDLKQNYGENVVTVAPEDKVLSSFFLTHLENIRRQGDYEIYIIADENDSLFCLCEHWLNKQVVRDGHIHVVTYMGDICDTVMQLHDTMVKRRRLRSYGRIAVFWMGLFDISREMAYLPEQRPDGKKTSGPSLSGAEELKFQLDALFGDFSAEPEPQETDEFEEEMEGYNATDDISELMQEGPKRAIHHFCYYTSVGIALKTKCARVTSDERSSFTHKLSLSIGKEEASSYFGTARFNMDAEGKALDNKTAVYYNGRVGTQFMPFIGEVEEKLNERQRT